MLKTRTARRRLTIRLATAADRERIYALRHEVYARELGQHRPNEAERLEDPLDGFNEYIVAADGARIAGFVSITAPGAPSWSIDKYFRRSELGLRFDGGLYEVRLLTVAAPWRGGPAAALLMHATLRWVESRGGREIVIIGRRELEELYRRVGFEPLGPRVRSGAVEYVLMAGRVAAMRACEGERGSSLRRLRRAADWALDVPFEGPARDEGACAHGGAFFGAIGEEFDALERRAHVVNADVLDAWFDPAPEVVEAVREHLPWLLRTSPPTGCEGLVRAVARARGVDEACVVPGAGSSDLIFRAFTRWLGARSRALVLDPTYGEYAHVLERVVGCRVDRLGVSRGEGYALDPERIVGAAAGGAYDLIVLVNPNNPTGAHVPRAAMEGALARVPARTRVWVDEAYVEYAGPGESLERFAAASEHVVVCKSLSKVYALSGARAAYLVAPEGVARDLRRVTPPWAVGLPAQVAAVRALGCGAYYADRYARTAALREELARGLRARTGLEVESGVINCVLLWLPEGGPGAGEVVARCRERGVFVRDCSTISASFGSRCVRIAVKDEGVNRRVVDAVGEVVGALAGMRGVAEKRGER